MAPDALAEALAKDIRRKLQDPTVPQRIKDSLRTVRPKGK